MADSCVGWYRYGLFVALPMIFAVAPKLAFSQELRQLGPNAMVGPDGKCLPGLVDYPAYQSKYPNPYHMKECRCRECKTHSKNRWKSNLQENHWGYKDYFRQNTFGHATRSAFASNIREAAVERITLYQMDFYSEDSSNAQMLNPTGLERLEKAITINQAYGKALRVEMSRTRQEINEQRVAWLLEHPSALAAGITNDSIILVGDVASTAGTDAIRWYQSGINRGASSTPGSSSSGVSLPTNSQIGIIGTSQPPSQ